MSADTFRQGNVSVSCGDLPSFDDLWNLVPGPTKLERAMAMDQDTASVEVLVDRLTAGDLSGALACCVAFQNTSAKSGHPAYPAIVLPAIRQMETLWQTDALSFDKVIAGFWLTRSLIERLGMLEGLSRDTATSKETCLVCLSAGEEHSFGAQMLADELRSRGSAVTLDLSGSAQKLVDLVAATPFDTVFISVNHDAALVGLADLIEDLRISSCNPRLRIMVGGSTFSGPDKSYAFLGSDGIGRTIGDALNWIGSKPVHAESVRH